MKPVNAAPSFKMDECLVTSHNVQQHRAFSSVAPSAFRFLSAFITGKTLLINLHSSPKPHTHTNTHINTQGKPSISCVVDSSLTAATRNGAPEDGAGNAPQACFQSSPGERAHLYPLAGPGLGLVFR